jgi:hypothetical protein
MKASPCFPGAIPAGLGFVACLASSLPALQGASVFPEAEIFGFTDRHCSACHNDVDREGGLDLTSLKFTPADAGNFQTWVKVHDRVQAGEMPPKEKKRPAAAELSAFIKELGPSLATSEREMLASTGRATRRRLNRSEYEHALRDLLSAPWVQVKDQLPEDGEAFRFNKVGEALDVSYVHMVRYMGAADYAMRQAIGVKLVQPPTTRQRYYARDESGLTNFQPRQGNSGPPERQKFPVLGTQAQTDVRFYRVPTSVGAADPKTRQEEAVGWTSSNYVTGFDSRWGNFRAPVAGRYRLTFSGYTLWVGPNGHGVRFANGRDNVGVPRPRQWYLPNYDIVEPGRRNEAITVYSQGGPQNRRLGEFDVTPTPDIQHLGEVWLLANEYIVTDATRFFRSRPTGFQGGYTNPLAQPDGSPAVAFRWMEVEGPIYDESATAGYQLLFGDLPLEKVAAGTPGVAIDVAPARSTEARGPARTANRLATVIAEVKSANPPQDAERLLRGFIQRAYRRPVEDKEVQRFAALVQQRMQAGLGFAGSMLAGYTAVLSSPEFVFVDDKPGRLDDHALATRLALFLWNSEPDAALRGQAARGDLSRPAVLRAETERMLADPKLRRFVDAFLDYWLEIRRMDETTPSTTLYNDYYLDDALTEAALAETQLYFSDLLAHDRPARNIVDSDFTFLNERLATHYDLTGVAGASMRRVSLPAGSVRGGFMTQAAVLKVTANGTTTSPVMRGKWIMERIVGFDMPPPPAAVPAVEPDIRGAVTIRQQLDKHRADESCAVCHRKIDPPGFALESFDVMGAWRERYRANALDSEPVPGFGKNGWPFAFSLALPVDPSGELPGGRAFKDVRDFKRILLQDETQLARNFARQLSVYATGAPVRFSDREKIEAILRKTHASQYGIRSIVHELIQSELFLNK